jgi:hypothetical protein
VWYYADENDTVIAWHSIDPPTISLSYLMVGTYSGASKQSVPEFPLIF